MRQVGVALRPFLLAALYLVIVPPSVFSQSPAFACTSTIDFGTIPLGQFTLSTIWCTNTQTFPVAFDYGGTSGFEDFETNPCVGGNCYDTFPMVIPAGGRFGIVVAFHPTVLGPRSGSTTILNDAGLPNSVISFSGIGESVPTDVVVPMLDRRGEIVLVAALALAAVLVIRFASRVA